MNGPNTSQRKLSGRWKALLAVAASLFWVSCSILLPRQGWNPSYGPVVPHDSFPADCSLCHVTENWQTLRADFTFDHEKETGVKLEGAHAAASCLLCHNDRGPVKQFAARGCAGCHLDPHRGRIGNDCSACHSESHWRPKDMLVRHNRTRFPLIGVHASTTCVSCHKGAPVGNFEGADISCSSCHLKDYNKTTDPNHAASGFSTDCTACHTPLGWEGAFFGHPSSFPLVGSHAGVACKQCHTGNGFKGLSTNCVTCHQSAFAATTNPNHAAAGFGTECQTCHTATSWKTAVFAHTPAFALTGGHAGKQCSDCHLNNVFKGLPSSCVSCHQANYNATTKPNHVTAGYGTDCQSCHNTLGWQGANFTHPVTFPLTGGHNGVACSTCHKNNVYTGLSTSCVSCHQADFNGTTNPNHGAALFSTTCNTCHTTNAWKPVSYTHTAAFPLTGGHAGQQCTTCHKNNIYKGLPSTCVSCHLTEYNNTTNPNHATSGFGTDCKVCHSSTTTWQGAVFNHKFPIKTGAHKNLNCTDCHTTPGNQAVFSCTHCHEHRQSEANNEHSGVSGYVWSSPSSYQCHPNGK